MASERLALGPEHLEWIRDNIDTLSPEDRQKALEAVLEYNVGRARSDFLTYVRLMAPLLIPDGFEEGPHIDVISKELTAVEQGTRLGNPKRLQISICPRSTKTLLLDMFISWVLGRNPTWKILHISHTQSLIEDIGGRVIRDLIQTPEFQAIFPDVTIKRDSRSASRWQTVQGGIYFCAGVNAQIAGRGANIIVLDDAMAEQSAASKVERERINNWYVRAARTRLWKWGSEIAIGTRWRVDDILGTLQRLDGTEENPVQGSRRPWKVITIPAVVDKKASLLLDIPEGESYWPKVKPLEDLLEMKRSMSEGDWRALYLQTPVLEDGNVFRHKHFKWWDHSEPPGNIKSIIVAADTAFSTTQQADMSAYVCYGLFDRMAVMLDGRERNVTNAILLEFEQGRWDFPGLVEKMQEVNDAILPDTFVIEEKGSGISLIQEMTRRGLPVIGYKPINDKVTRAHSVIPIHAGGRVWFPKKKFAWELYEELKGFPTAVHDDAVDAHVLAMIYLRDTYELTNPNYLSEREEETSDYRPNKPRTYWSSVTGNL